MIDFSKAGAGGGNEVNRIVSAPGSAGYGLPPPPEHHSAISNTQLLPNHSTSHLYQPQTTIYHHQPVLGAFKESLEDSKNNGPLNDQVSPN